MKQGRAPCKAQPAFTIVELLIVIVVIGILAALVISTFSGAQARARDADRKADISALKKALELYHTDKGEYPPTGAVCANGNNGWATTSDKDGCWKTFTSLLSPYLGGASLLDPISTQGVTGADLYYSYNYTITTYYCSRQTYWITYNTELPIPGAVTEGSAGGCAALPTGTYPQTDKHHVIFGSKVQ